MSKRLSYGNMHREFYYHPGGDEEERYLETSVRLTATSNPTSSCCPSRAQIVFPRGEAMMISIVEFLH